MRAVLLLLGIPTLVSAAPLTALQPLGFLAGHCWRGTVPATLATEEHCFAWTAHGQALADTLTVVTPGAAPLHATTIYSWDPVRHAARFRYRDSVGGAAHGTLETLANTLYQHPDAATPAPVRARWQPQGSDAFQLWTEARGAGGAWNTVRSMTLQKTR